VSGNLTKNTNIDTISKKILSWFFGSFMLLFSLLLLYESILASTLGFFGALISIPPTGKLINQFLQSKYNFIIEGKLKVVVCFVLFVFLMSAIPETSRHNLPNTEHQQSPVSSAGTQNIALTKNEQSKSHKSNVVVKSLIVKKVDGKFRYFFDIRNNGTEDFNGEVSIYLYNNKQSLELGRDTFKTEYPINPKLGNYVWIEINTGTPLIHGEFGITKFKYEVKVDNIITKSEEDVISKKYENLSY
jgi:hypothetical protein